MQENDKCHTDICPTCAGHGFQDSVEQVPLVRGQDDLMLFRHVRRSCVRCKSSGRQQASKIIGSGLLFNDLSDRD